MLVLNYRVNIVKYEALRLPEDLPENFFYQYVMSCTDIGRAVSQCV